MFKQFDNKLVIKHLQCHFKQTCPLFFDHVFSINDDLTVYCTKNRQILGKVNDMLTFYNKQGAGPIFASINISNKRKPVMPVEMYNK